MSLHADAEMFCQMRLATGVAKFHELTPQAAREAGRTARAAANVTPGPVGKIVDFSVPPPGGAVPIRLCRPDTDITGANMPAVIFFHGATMAFFRGNYLKDISQAEDWRVSPILADLNGVAATYVLTLGHDPVRDEGKAYVKALRKAGVPTQTDHIADQIHGMLTLGAAMPSVAGHIEYLGRRLAEGLGKNIGRQE